MRGPQVMQGYWNNPAATADVIDAEGWFRTGDAGYLDADGYLYIHDRVKDMIVSGGENVYPAEVENVLMGHPAIADVAVIGVPDERWGETVKAIVVLEPGGAARRRRRDRLRTRAPRPLQVPDQRRRRRRAAAQPQRQDPEEGPPGALLGGPRAPGQLGRALARWWANSSFAARLTVVTAVGAAWRLTYLFAVKADDRLLLNDSIYYSIQAGLNSEGHWFEDALSGQPGAEHPPLTSLYLTPWSIGGGDSVVWQRFAITVLGIATVAVIGLVGRDIGRRLGRGAYGDRVGLVAAAIAVVYPNLWVNDSLVMSETPAMLLVALCLLAVLRWDRRPGWPIALLTGVLVGLAALTRSELALFVPAFALVALVQAHRRRTSWVPALVMVGAALVTLAPWTIYNAGRFDQPVLLSTNDGNTLLGANCDRTYFDDVGGWDIRCLGPLADASGVVPDASVRSQRRRDEAFDYVGDHLGAAAGGRGRPARTHRRRLRPGIDGAHGRR